jgi:hypothetical protein
MKIDSENLTKITLNSTKGSLQNGIEADKLKVEMCQSKNSAVIYLKRVPITTVQTIC